MTIKIYTCLACANVFELEEENPDCRCNQCDSGKIVPGIREDVR